MKKDIEFPKVVGVKVAIVKKINELNQEQWYAYLINTNDFGLDNVLITSQGYGEIEGEKRKTSTLRHLIEYVAPESHALIEPIDPVVFQLCSEYWVSYYIDRQIFDKKFIFLPETIIEDNLIEIKQLSLKGILHE
ncbi:MAG: hypothetical protein ACFB0B_22600 [Thermonemataceae bacterium]